MIFIYFPLLKGNPFKCVKIMPPFHTGFMKFDHCQVCSELITRNGRLWLVGGVFYCGQCAVEHTIVCKFCGGRIIRTEANHTKWNATKTRGNGKDASNARGKFHFTYACPKCTAIKID